MDFDSPRETLSSEWTFFHKFIVPALWIGGFALGTLMLLLSPYPGGAGAFFILFSAGFLLCYFVYLPLKWVELDHKYLYVSNYRKTIRIPVSKIESVIEAPFANFHPIWIRLRSPTEFGRTIIFIPYFHAGSLFTMAHPEAAKLRKFVAPTLYV